jgi:hypothetical protein
MPVSNLFQSYLQQPVKSVADYQADYDAQDLRRAQMENAQRQNALAALQFGAQQDEIAQKRRMQNAIQAIYSNPENADPLKREAALLADPNTAERGLQLQKERLANEETMAKTGEAKARAGKAQGETMDAALKRYRSGLDFVDTPQSAARWLAAQYNDPQLSQHMQSFGPLEQAVAQIPTDPAGFQRWRQRNALGMDAFVKMQQEDRKIAETERNNRAQVEKDIANNIRTNQTSLANNAATVAATMRGQDLVNARAVDAAEQGKLHYDADRGGVVNLKTNEFKPAMQGGNAVGEKDKPLTEGQAKANMFGTRMQEADRILANLARSGVDRPGALKRTAEGVVGIIPEWAGREGAREAAGALTNWTQSPGQQQAEQAQRDFLNAVLRRESGAAISPSEFTSASKQYFPQAGDSDEVLAQKARNRQIAVQTMLAEVPQNKRTKVAAPSPQVVDFGSLK